MPPRDRLKLRIESAVVHGLGEPRQVVHLYVNGHRFELEAPSARARQIVVELARAFGLDEDLDAVS